MKHHKTKPSFLQNQFKEVTEPVRVQPEKVFPYFETFIILVITAIITVALLTLAEIWIAPFFK